MPSYPPTYRGRCAHCPFNFKNNIEGADFDQEFTEKHVEAWTDPQNPWPCHLSPLSKPIPCKGAKDFLAGKSDVTKQEIIDFWVLQKEPNCPPPA